MIAAPTQALQAENQFEFQAPGGAPMSFADLIETVSPAVVSIEASGTPSVEDNQPDLSQVPPQLREFFERFGGLPQQQQQRPRRSSGSGFFISEDGFVVTNNHVIAGTDEIQIALADGRTFDVEVVGTDELTDLAVLRVIDRDGAEFEYVQLERDLEARVGDWVVAVGNPFGLGGTATAGIVSALSRELDRGPVYNDFLQFDAPINPGNSGGPTFDLNGKVVGVNSAIISATRASAGISLAIPSDTAALVIDQLIENGLVRRGFLGVRPADLTSDMREAMGLGEDTQGALINNVIEDTPAEKAGLKNGDIILRVQNEPVEDARDLTRKVGSFEPGETIRFRISREGSERNVRVTLAERPEAEEAVGQGLLPTPEASSESFYGMSVRAVSNEERDRYSLDGETGLLVLGVEPGSEAERVGIRSGNVILQASNRDVETPGDLADAIEQARSRDRAALSLYVRSQSGTSGYVALRLDNTSED
jgi:serine protease Do